jgi:hypothetical protein
VGSFPVWTSGLHRRNGLTGSGRSVTFIDTTFTTQSTGGFSESFDQVVNGDFPTWSLGMSLEVRVARARRAGAKARSKRRGPTWRLCAAVEDQVRARRRERQRRVDWNPGGARAGAHWFDRYQNGRTPAFELVRLGGDVADAQRRYSDALVRTAKAAAELKRLAPVETTGSEE